MSAGAADTGGLRAVALDYLAMRRALGFKLSVQGRLLMGFVDYAERCGATTVTTETAVAWAIDTPRSRDPLWWSRRLRVVRIFARHLRAIDHAAEIPAEDVLAGRYRRSTPYRYSQEQIRALMSAAGRLDPPLRAATYTTVIGLLAVSGLRIVEAARLDRRDVDLAGGILTVRDSKFAKSRALPLHPSTTKALARYAAARDQALPERSSEAFFVSTRGTRLSAAHVPRTFASLLDAAGISAPAGSRRPRVHDLRHTFTLNTLIGWYRNGADAAALLPRLSTYLGHVDPKSTYWYLQASPELLALAAGRLERHNRATGGEQP